MIGSRHGLPGVAAGVAMAILCMFVTIGQLALRITGTTWRLYFRVQVYAMLVTTVIAATAMVILRLLEAVDASSAVILIAVVTGSALTWCVGFVWRLGEPDFLEIRNKLPLRFLHVVERIGQYGCSPEGPPCAEATIWTTRPVSRGGLDFARTERRHSSWESWRGASRPTKCWAEEVENSSAEGKEVTFADPMSTAEPAWLATKTLHR